MLKIKDIKRVKIAASVVRVSSVSHPFYKIKNAANERHILL